MAEDRLERVSIVKKANVTFRTGDAFDVHANSKLQLEIAELADYCCSYL